MEISGIFEIVPGSLYAVQFAGELDHEFGRVFTLWNDPRYLESFFESHCDDLLQFWEYMSVEEAVLITVKDAIVLEEAILNVAKMGHEGGFENLSFVFEPLYANPTSVDNFEKSKARGFRRRSWLRVYAVRMDVNKYVISGGAIKLTRTMNDRTHMVDELRKLEEVCRFLKGDQKDEFGLFELF